MGGWSLHTFPSFLPVALWLEVGPLNTVDGATPHTHSRKYLPGTKKMGPVWSEVSSGTRSGLISLSALIWVGRESDKNDLTHNGLYEARDLGLILLEPPAEALMAFFEGQGQCHGVLLSCLL